MLTDSGELLLIGNNGAAAKFDSPYRTKFGEPINSEDNTIHQVDYEIRNEGGGLKHLEEMKKMLENSNLMNSILQQRSNPDQRFRVYRRGAF